MRKKLGLLGASCVLIAGAAACEKVSLPACSEDAFDFHLVYVDSSVEDGGKLVGLRPDGERTRIAPHDKVAFSPDLSPDGDQLVFTSGRDGFPGGAGLIEKELYVIDADGDERRLTVNHLDEDPAWSPDGDWIVFVRATAARRAIFRFRPDGSDLEKLVDLGRGEGEASPVWSADGSQLAWLRSHPERSKMTTVAIANADGSEVRTVGEIENLSTLHWSPDGERFVTGPGPENEGIYFLDAESGESDLIRQDASNPVWEPDGSGVLFWDSSDPEEDRHVLTRYDIESGEETEVEGATQPWFLYSGYDIEPMPCE